MAILQETNAAGNSVSLLSGESECFERQEKPQRKSGAAMLLFNGDLPIDALGEHG